MPFINVTLVEGSFTLAQKQDMVRRLTEAVVSIEGEGVRSVTWVVVDEVKTGDQPITFRRVSDPATCWSRGESDFRNPQ